MAENSRKHVQCLVRSIDAKKRQVTVLVSSGSVDRYNEIILPSAFQESLEGYMANPVLLWGHRSGGGPEMVIGKCVGIRLVAAGLEATFEYCEAGVNPLADMVWKMVELGIIRAFSIGAIVHEWVDKWSESPDLTKLPPYARDAFLSGECVRVYTKVELYEISQVIVPANRDALIAAMLTERVDRDQALRALGEIELQRGETPQKEEHMSEPTVEKGGRPGLDREALKSMVAEILKEAVPAAVREALQSAAAGDQVGTKTASAGTQEPTAGAKAPEADDAPLRREIMALIEKDPASALAALERMKPAA